MLWSGLEPTVGVICACLPTLGPIFKRQTLQSFIQSLNGIFLLGSRHSKDSHRSLPILRDQASRKRQTDQRLFYPMDDEQSLSTTVQPESKHENHSGGFPLRGIRVNSSVETKLDQRAA